MIINKPKRVDYSFTLNYPRKKQKLHGFESDSIYPKENQNLHSQH